MANTQKQFIQKMQLIHKKSKQLLDLATAREAAEKALVVEYRVKEVNQLRANLLEQYQPQVEQLNQEIIALRNELGDDLVEG